MPSAREVYKKVVPESVRNWVRSNSVFRKLRDLYRANTGRHDQFYTAEYYDDKYREGPATKAAPYVVEDIVKHLNPKSFLDIGCGPGEYLLCMRDRGVEVHGVDLASIAVERCVGLGLDVQKHDLTKPGPMPWVVDVVFSAEVAEHLIPSTADVFVDKLTGAAKQHVIMTAARPGQEGENHFNCQPKSYWVDKFAQRGFDYDEALTQQLEQRYVELQLADWFQSNLMVFHRKNPA